MDSGKNVPQGQTVNVPDSVVMLKAQIRLQVTRLFKNYLVLLEDLASEHDDAMGKLEDNLPPQYKQFVELADYWSDAKMDNLRRKILSAGNDVIRGLEESVDFQSNKK